MDGAKIAMSTNSVATTMPAIASGRRRRRMSARLRLRRTRTGAAATSTALIARAPAGSRHGRRSSNDAPSCLGPRDADARIQDRVQEVDPEVDDDVAERREQD